MEQQPILNEHNKSEHAPSHTAEHLLNQTMVRLFGCERSKNAHIERKKSKINFLLPSQPTAEQVADIERRMNELIAADLPVTYEFVTRDTIPVGVKLDKLPDDASETLRLVCIGTSPLRQAQDKCYPAEAYDVCPCIGQHVASTAEIGNFRITSTSWTPAAEGELGSFRIVFKVNQ